MEIHLGTSPAVGAKDDRPDGCSFPGLSLERNLHHSFLNPPGDRITPISLGPKSPSPEYVLHPRGKLIKILLGLNEIAHPMILPKKPLTF